jgi:putative ABC transport system ATP-binding protein
MGYIFQAYHLIPVLTALENVALPLIARGIKEVKAKARALDALNQVGLADKAYGRPGELSGGQNQRVAIARAIVGNPKVIWADEPTGALDGKTAEQIVGLLKMLNETLNTTIVIVTHDSNVAQQTRRIIEMDNGRMISHGGRTHV